MYICTLYLLFFSAQNVFYDAVENIILCSRTLTLFFENLVCTDFIINEQGGQIYLLNLISKQAKNVRVWWKKNLKNLSEHACLLGTSE